MSVQEVVLMSSVVLALGVLRLGIPMLCTWGLCRFLRRFARQPEHA